MKLLSTSLKPSVKKGLHKKIKRGLLISFSTSCKATIKKGLHKKIKEEGLLMLLSTSSQPSMKKGLHKIIKKEGLMKFVVDYFETKCEERASQDNQRGRPLD